MRGALKISVLATLALIAGVCLLSAAAGTCQAQATPALTDDDCIKCHQGPPADVAAAGGAHKDTLCSDCHGGHRPMSENNIPACSDCHDGEPHYALAECLGCHTNPHTPLNITVGDKVTDPCLSCHTEQIAQLKDNPSKHTELFCSTCHDVHRKIPPCLDCHDSHGETMTQADCGNCHKPHMPTVLTYGADVPNKDCATCHKTVNQLLSSSTAKHRDVACVTCHEERHTMVPDCQNCHPEPHPAGIFVKFPKCGDCHYIAHDLNNWPAEKKPAAKQ